MVWLLRREKNSRRMDKKSFVSIAYLLEKLTPRKYNQNERQAEAEMESEAGLKLHGFPVPNQTPLLPLAAACCPSLFQLGTKTSFAKLKTQL